MNGVVPWSMRSYNANSTTIGRWNMPNSDKKLGAKDNGPGAIAIKAVPKKPARAPKKRVDPYLCPEFTQRLIDHMHRAKIAALSDAQE